MKSESRSRLSGPIPSNCSDPIYPELIMHIGLRWLDGGAYADILDTAGISTTSVYRCRDLFMDAVLAANEIAINLPQTAA